MNLKYDITGQIKHIGNIETVGQKGFQKRLLVITDPADKYPQEIPLEATGDMMNRLDNLKVGQWVDASFWLGGREWQGRWFSSLKLAFVKVVEAQEDEEHDVSAEGDENLAF